MFLLAFTAYCIKQNNSSETNRLSAGASLNSIIGGQVGNSPSRRIVTGAMETPSKRKGRASGPDIGHSYQLPLPANRIIRQRKPAFQSGQQHDPESWGGESDRRQRIAGTGQYLSISRLEKGSCPPFQAIW